MDKYIGCIDLFCGVGGLTHGLIKSGIKVIAGTDIDKNCRFPYESNNDTTFICKDINNFSGKELNGLFSNSKLRLLAGCAPCQPFSKYNRTGTKDNKWQLLSEFSRLITETYPELVTMENVPQLSKHDVFSNFLKSLDGYNVWWDIVESQKYGVPQTRKRLVLLASRLGTIKLLPPEILKQNHIVTVRQAIEHLPAIKAGEKNENDVLHISSGLTEINLLRIKASKPGGTWRDWDESLRATCHCKDSGKYYSSVYGRMEWDKPAPTITTQCYGFGNGRFGHPEQNRAISLREAAILQTFPENYKFIKSASEISFNQLGRLIGNAVPVRLSEIIGTSFLTHIEEYCR